MKLLQGVGIGALSWCMGLYGAGSAKIGNRYFRDASTPRKEPRTPEEVGAKRYTMMLLEGDFIPASGGSLVDEALTA